VDSKAGLDAVEKRKSLACRESNPVPAIRSPSLYRLSYPDSTNNNNSSSSGSNSSRSSVGEAGVTVVAAAMSKVRDRRSCNV
jgi:hypothetical protein